MLSDASVVAPLLGPGGWGKGSRVFSEYIASFASTDGKHIDWHARAFYAPVVAVSAVNDHVEHARRRRTWTRAFSQAALRDHEEIVNKRVVQLTEILAARKSVDLARLFGYFS